MIRFFERAVVWCIFGAGCAMAAGIWGEKPQLAGFLVIGWLVHELGHWLALRAMGFRGELKVRGALGAAVDLPPGCQGWREGVAALAGPAANLIVLLAAKMGGWELLFAANFVMAAVNLLPFLPLDGGKAIRGFFGGIFSWFNISKLLLLWGKGLAIAYVGVVYWFGLERWLLLGAVWLYLLACLEERSLPYLLGTRLEACLGERWRPRRTVRARAGEPLYRVVERFSPGWRNMVISGGERIEGDDLVRRWLGGEGMEILAGKS